MIQFVVLHLKSDTQEETHILLADQAHTACNANVSTLTIKNARRANGIYQTYTTSEIPAHCCIACKLFTKKEIARLEKFTARGNRAEAH